MSEGKQRVAIADQVKAVQEAVNARVTVIRHEVRIGKTRELAGDMEIGRLKAGVESLLWLQKYETQIKARIGGTQS